MHSFSSFSLVVLSAVAVYFVAITPASSQDSGVQLSSIPTDIQVSSFDASVIVSAGNGIHRLNPDLTLNSSVTTHDRKIGHRIALSYNNSESVLVCKETFCTHYEIDWLNGELISYSSSVGNGFNSIPLAIDPNGFYVATSDTISVAVAQFDEHFRSVRSYDQRFLHEIIFERQFLHGFVYADFVYFLAIDSGTDQLSNNVRIVRFCHELPDDELPVFEASYEAILECGVVSASSRVEVSNSLLDEFGNATITLAVTTNTDTNICSFSLKDIDDEMDASFNLCLNNYTLTIPLVWYDEHTCAALRNSVDMCHFDTNFGRPVPALATFNAVAGHHLLHFNGSEEVTAILTVRVDSATDFLFVAYSTTNGSHLLDKYHIRSNSTLELATRDQYTLPVILLRLNEIVEDIYGANANSVFEVPLEKCSNYTTCVECASSKDPLCGWYAVEQYCSRDFDLTAITHKGRWVNNHEQCVMSVFLAKTSIDVDLIESVEVIVNPPEAVLPSSPPHYKCTFYHENRENVSYNFTVPFVGTSCQLQQAQIDDFTGKTIDLNFSLLLTNQAIQLFPSSSVLTLHNCSLYTDCGSCVEASSSCGWCVHDRTCTGNPANCRHEEDWRTLTHQQEGDLTVVCPLVVTPDHGSYTLPVSVRRELILSTLNIPPEIPDYRYGCQMRYGDDTVLQLVSHYHNDTKFRCVTSENQVHLSSTVTNGTEAVMLEVLWVRNADNFTIVLHSVKATLYSCLQLGTGCSSCLSANIGTGFNCIWCDREQVDDMCTVLDDCRTQSTFFDKTSQCPLPAITSISPKSGPTLGGTVLTVRGSDLGAVATDVSVELVKRGSMAQRIPCITDNTEYIPGVQVVCTTQEASEGDYFVVVNVVRGNTTKQPRRKEHTFTYAHPIVNSVEPTKGPKAGGTEITFLGSNLAISRPGTAQVFIGDIPCDIKVVTSKAIVCVSRPVSTASADLRTRIIIDNADMHSELFNYTEDPVFTMVEPQNIIPAGGVTLTFKGNYLDVVLNPELIMTIDNTSISGVCTPKSSTILKCIAPKLPPNTVFDNVDRKRNAAVPISYTITMDGADGPVSSDSDLQLTVKPDPEFFKLHTEDREYTLESGRTIRILGSNINSVLPSELSVMVDEAPCTIVNDDVTATQVRCFPPDTVLPGDRLVTVFVGESDLNYTVGLLRYYKAQSGANDNNDLLLIIIPALAGVIVLMLSVLAILCLSVGVLIRRKRAYKAKQRMGLREESKSDLELVAVMPNMYNGSRHIVGDHEYDTIPDVLEQMQLQQMEMAACAAQHGIPFTTSSAGKRSDNIYYSEDEGRGSSASSSKDHSSRPNSSSTSGGSRPHSSSMTGSLTSKPVKRPPLPPLPTSMSDEYVAMHSYPVGNASPVDTTVDKTQPDTDQPGTTTATVVVHEPAVSEGDETGAAGYDKLAPKEQLETAEDEATNTLILTLPEQQSQDDSTV